MSAIRAFSNAPEERLLRALAEQLKIPLIQIARSAELAQGTSDLRTYGDIEYAADMALRLVDGYLLGVQLQSQPNLELEPIALGSVLEATAHKLSRLANQYACDLDIRIDGKYEPVMSNRQALETAYISLGYAFIESAPEGKRRHQVVLGAHRSSHGLVAGVYGDQSGWGSDVLKRGRAIYGQARQSVPALSADSGASLFVADYILSALSVPLRAARYRRLSGVAATLLPSKQLQLV